MQMQKVSLAYISGDPLASVGVTTSFLPGLLTGLSLIVAIGAQNAYVLRQGTGGVSMSAWSWRSARCPTWS